MTRNSFSQLKVHSPGQESDHSRGLPGTMPCAPTSWVISPTLHSHSPACISAHTPPTQISMKGNFKILFKGNSYFCRLRRSLNWGGLRVLKLMGSCMKVRSRRAESLQKMMVGCVSGRPTPTARFWKPAHVTMWLVLCSSMQRGNGAGNWRWGVTSESPLPIRASWLSQRLLASLPGVSQGV